MAKVEQRIVDVLVAAECEPVALLRKEIAHCQQQWRTVFAAELHAATGTWVHLGFEWHVFSYRYRRAAAGDDAWAAYRACNGKPPERLKCGIDVIVSPPVFDWTMAFTHEAGFGPYFATR